jgi:hypothetical protein
MWYTTSLLELTGFRHTADQVDTLSQSLLRTSKELYQRDSTDLKAHARNGDIQPQKFAQQLANPGRKPCGTSPKARRPSGSITTSRKAAAWITWCGMTAMSGYIPPA